MDKKRLKIAFLCRFLGDVQRGVETYVLELSKRLEKNHQIDIYTGKASDSLTPIVKGNYQLVIPTNGRMQALRSSLGRISGGYKTLISGQAGIGRDDLWNILITAPNVYVALTDYELEWAKKWAVGTNVVKIPNGVDLNRFKPSGLKIKLKLQPPIILSVGALEWYKHHERSIMALHKLGKGSLLIIGKGRKEGKLTKLGQSLLGSNRFQIICANYADLDKYYRSADLFVLPSWDRESFGIVYLEAMACNLAVVVPDDPPRREIIGDAGLFVKVANENQYAVAIEKALLKQWRNVPRKQAEKFSWDKIALDYEQLIQDMFKS